MQILKEKFQKKPSSSVKKVKGDGESRKVSSKASTNATSKSSKSGSSRVSEQPAPAQPKSGGS